MKGLFGAFNDIRLQPAKVRRYMKCGQGDRLSPLKAVGIIEGLPGVLGNKGTKGQYRREQGNMTPDLGNTGT